MRQLLLTLGLILLGACTPQPPEITLSGRAFEQPLTLTVRGAPQDSARRAAQGALQDLLFVAEISHPWNPGPLGRTNQLLSFTAEFSANPSVLPLLDKATRLAAQTRGYYAPALGQLQQLWGFHSDLPDGAVPDERRIRAILDAAPSLQDIRLDGIRMKSVNPAVRIDFGALAQGHALDTARLRLQESGIRFARVDNGNAVAVLGEGGHVALPGGDTITLQAGEAAVTLSSDDRAFSSGGRQYHPYLNPQSGHPGSGLRRVTVLHHSAASAAALAQALMAGGVMKLDELLAVIPIQYALVRTDEGETVTTTPMRSRLTAVRP